MKKIFIFGENTSLNKSFVRLCSVTVMIIAALLMYAGISLGWFASQLDSSAGGMTVDIIGNADNPPDITFHELDSIDSANVYFSIEEMTGEHKLDEYDFLEKASRYIMIRIAMKDGYSATRLYAAMNNAYDSFMNAGESAVPNVENPFSSIAYISVYTDSDVNMSDGKYQLALPTARKSFSAPSTDSNGRVESIVMSPSIELYSGGASELYIIVEYYTELLDYALSNDFVVTDGNESIVFTEDFKFVLEYSNTENQ